MNSQSDLFERAAACDRLRDEETDEIRKTAFRLLRDMWIALANESAEMSREELTQEVSALAEIQSGLQRSSGSTR
jgi:hypothetical protein